MKNFGDYKSFLPELYDLIPPYADRRDVDFYIDICRAAGGKVLELGCGTGRVLIPVAAAGINITGLDLSPHMLDRCREKLAAQSSSIRQRVKLVQKSMIDFDLEEIFSLVIMPFRPFQHLISIKDQIACLRCVSSHLNKGGKFAFDVFQLDYQKITDPRAREENEDVPEFKLPDGRKIRRCSKLAATHQAEQYNDVEIIYYVTDTRGNTKRLVQAFPFRYFFRYEVEHLLARCGFTVCELYGDFNKSPLNDDSPEMIFIAEKIN